MQCSLLHPFVCIGLPGWTSLALRCLGSSKMVLAMFGLRVGLRFLQRVRLSRIAKKHAGGFVCSDFCNTVLVKKLLSWYCAEQSC